MPHPEMKTSLILRASFSAAVLGAALAAQAFAVSLVSSGTFSEAGGIVTQNENVLISHLGSYPTLSSVVVTVDTNPSPITTTAVYTSASGTLTFGLTYENTSVGDFGINTDSGTWDVLSGTLAYAGISGHGSYSINYNSDDNNFVQTTLVGTRCPSPRRSPPLAWAPSRSFAAARRRKDHTLGGRVLASGPPREGSKRVAGTRAFRSPRRVGMRRNLSHKPERLFTMNQHLHADSSPCDLVGLR